MTELPGQKAFHAFAQQFQHRLGFERPLDPAGAVAPGIRIGLQPAIELTQHGQIIQPFKALFALADQLMHQQFAPADVQPVEQHLRRPAAKQFV
ncbi:hypothetical protein D3C86_1750600 [compost metagenome]